MCGDGSVRIATHYGLDRTGIESRQWRTEGGGFNPRFKIIDDPTCLCKMNPQTTDHLLWECDLLKKQRQVLRKSIRKTDGNWPITNSDLANKYTKFFQRFVNTINFESL